MNWADVGEVIKAVAPVFTAGAACTGAWIAYRGLEKWRAETIGKRKAELAEQALASMYEVRDVFQWARTRVIFPGEGETRSPEEDEPEKIKARRNRYSVPIERLHQDKELFARLQSQRYTSWRISVSRRRSPSSRSAKFIRTSPRRPAS